MTIRRSFPELVIALALASCAISVPAQDFSQTQTKPAPSAALVQQANDALAAGDLPTALKLLTALNTQSPNNPQVLYNLGQITESLPESTTPTADTWYRQAIAANPLVPAPHIALGLLLARTGHSAEAHTELATATTLTDAEPALKARAFRALARLDTPANPQAASTELLAALKLTPETPDDILLSAEIAESGPTPDLPAAEQAYRRYLNVAPNDATATAALAHILLAQHHPAEAESLLTAALARTPDDPTLTSQLAAAYLGSGDPAKVAQATPLLESLHAAKPQDPNVTRLLARVYLETGHPDQADTLYAALIASAGPTPDPTLLADHAEVLMRLHRPGAAETLLKQATANPRAFPTPAAYADALTHLAFASAEIDDPKMTLQSLTLRSNVLPPTPSTLFLEATANDTLHESRKAVDLYKQFLAAAHGNFPEQESQAKQRLAVLDHRK